MLYHEARSGTILEQQIIAQIAQNRAIVQHKTVCQIVFDGNQFNWAKRFKPRYKFNTSVAMMAYYRIDDGNAFITSLGVSSMSALQTSDAYFYHDKRIKSFSWDKNKLTVVGKTKNFTFYRKKQNDNI